MKNYKTSKNYKKLRELLDNGYEVVVWANGYGINIARKKVYTDFSSYDFCGFVIFSSRLDTFTEILKDKHLEYIVPTK